MADSHDGLIDEQFTQQAELFSAAPALHNEGALDLLVQAGAAKGTDRVLDVACGPGTVVAAFARVVEYATGLDATEAMLDEARKLADKEGLENVSWQQGSVYELPFGEGTFDIVSCRFAFHHFEESGKAFSEMVRVCKPGGRIVLCDAVVSDDPAKALAFNEMEQFRDPSTVEFRSLDYLKGLFIEAGFGEVDVSYYQVPVELEGLCKVSFPVNDDYEGLRRMIVQSIDGDTMGVNARYKGEKVLFAYNAVVLSAVKN